MWLVWLEKVMCRSAPVTRWIDNRMDIDTKCMRATACILAKPEQVLIAKYVKNGRSLQYSLPCRRKLNIRGMGHECVMCCERPANIEFYGCGHVATCTFCTIKYFYLGRRGVDSGFSLKCPVCVQDITGLYIDNL